MKSSLFSVGSSSCASPWHFSLAWCLAILVVLGYSSNAVAQSRPGNPQASGTSMVDIKPSPIKRIDPGTEIGDTAPEGWTYMLFKNRSTIGAGDMDAATDMLKNLASLFGSVMVTNVVPNSARTQYVLSDIGHGLYTRVGNTDKVVTYATYKKIGARLSLIQSLGLSQAEARIDKLLITARTPTMAIVDSPSLVFLQGKHWETMVRHAILLNPKTGNVVTAVWFFLPRDGRVEGQILSEMDCVEPNTSVDIVLHLDKSEFTLGMVTERALALNQMMWGKRQVPLPRELHSLGRLLNFSEDQVLQLESGLRQVVQP